MCWNIVNHVYADPFRQIGYIHINQFLLIHLVKLFVPKYGILFYHWSVYQYLGDISVLGHFNETAYSSDINVQQSYL